VGGGSEDIVPLLEVKHVGVRRARSLAKAGNELKKPDFLFLIFRLFRHYIG